MGMIDRALTSGLNRVSLGSLTLTATNETLRAKVPSAMNPALLQAKLLTERVSIAEVWVPVGVSYIITTGITVTAAVLQLWKNGVAPTSTLPLGSVTAAIQALGPDEIFVPFVGNYVYAAADAAGDAWSLKVTTTSTAGVINPVYLWYAVRQVPAINEGISI